MDSQHAYTTDLDRIFCLIFSSDSDHHMKYAIHINQIIMPTHNHIKETLFRRYGIKYYANE